MITKTDRHYSLCDHFLVRAQSALAHCFDIPKSKKNAYRPSPGDAFPSTKISEKTRKHVAACMRVNHVGELCAQALYRAQAWTTKNTDLQVQFKEAASEEEDHLFWCAKRLKELNDRPSYLNPIWYAGSLGIGCIAGLCGDQYSLGFLSETEHQVSAHLEKHLASIPKEDQKTIAILKTMQAEELLHAEKAQNAGADILPKPIRLLMKVLSKVMTRTAYYL